MLLLRAFISYHGRKVSNDKKAGELSNLLIKFFVRRYNTCLEMTTDDSTFDVLS